MKYAIDRITLVALFGAASALAQSVPESDQGASQVSWRGREVTYLRFADNGVLTPGKVWEGVKVFKMSDGSCVKVERTDLRLVKVNADGDVAHPEFKETKTRGPCPGSME